MKVERRITVSQNEIGHIVLDYLKSTGKIDNWSRVEFDWNPYMQSDDKLSITVKWEEIV